MKKNLINYLLIFLGAIIIYGVTVFFNYTYLDDQSLILENQAVLSSFTNVGQLFSEDVFFSDNNFYYRPLLNFSFMIEAQFAGPWPWLYHLSNIIFHALATCLLFTILLLLGASLLKSRFLSLLFLIHPALISTVAWIPGRNDSLLAVFVLTSFLFFIRLLKDKKIRFFSLSLVFYLLALFTKETAIFLPLLLLFYYLFLSKEKFKKQEGLLFTLAIMTLTFLWFLFRSLAIDTGIGSFGEIMNSILHYSPLFIVSLGKFFLPFNLAPISLLFEANIIFGLVSMLFLSLLALNKNIEKRYLAFGLLWFILFLLPALLNPDPIMSYQLMMLEHRLYLPFIGLIFILISFKIKLDFKYIKISKALAAVILLLFITITFSKLPYYRDSLSFWHYALKTTQNSPLAHRNLGAMYHLRGDLNKAEKYYQKSLEINPQEPMANYNLGLIYEDRQELDKAEKFYIKELELNPGYLNAIIALEDLHNLKKKLR